MTKIYWGRLSFAENEYVIHRRQIAIDLDTVVTIHEGISDKETYIYCTAGTFVVEKPFIEVYRDWLESQEESGWISYYKN